MASEATGRDSDKFMLRLPNGMRDRIADAARANNRSMNAEIVSRLEASLSDGTEQGRSLLKQHDLLVEIQDRYAELELAYQRQTQQLDRRRFQQDEDLAERTREAAAAAMQVALFAVTSAARAAELKDGGALGEALMPTLLDLESAISSEDPYAALQMLRGRAVHPPISRASKTAGAR
ncbi:MULTISPECIES: Arc family DNA-binding protein [unclassified Methylobacterium]|uniref:Arc family DNA-binding protein n=1 Tax=unclassified Methylobacterium TaxID=2615210 RepID=UPI002269F34F|nr:MULTISPECIES: Arc family DNA-binding protein [unclassified Methylobacterium]